MPVQDRNAQKLTAGYFLKHPQFLASGTVEVCQLGKCFENPIGAKIVGVLESSHQLIMPFDAAFRPLEGTVGQRHSCVLCN